MKFEMKIFIFTLLGVCLSAPLHEHTSEDDPELTAGYFEGDIVLDADRNGARRESRRWPNNTVYYKFHADFDAAHRGHILRGMNIIERASCIRFKEATAYQSYFINITSKNDGCYASVGWANNVRSYNLKLQPIDKGCFRLGSIMHELLHTIGFYHMQSTWNRDDYVYIVEDNIKPGSEYNFKKQDKNVVDDFDEEYDYGSIMHYGPYAFSVNGKMTIVPLQEYALRIIGQRRGLSQTDINKLNIMYRCPLHAM